MPAANFGPGRGGGLATLRRPSDPEAAQASRVHSEGLWPRRGFQPDPVGESQNVSWRRPRVAEGVLSPSPFARFDSNRQVGPVSSSEPFCEIRLESSGGSSSIKREKMGRFKFKLDSGQPGRL